ncbi:hypothetical protein IYY11_13940 [Methylocystis sp. H62]|uniref:hypothetical protein n=1 Tax=Methylocystis sp. H62 TaxID=2785789 RepID=UPI0018C2793F|nr:hypothetical protein [Methylocystis sp. H62]MBG0794455.1 hypothetical protein [Methylocystis sp. H62]
MPEDITGVTTYDIVRQIRCETRQALIELIGEYLSHSDDDRVNMASRMAGVQYFIKRSKPLEQFGPKLLSGHAKEAVELFWKSGIAYNFQLGVQENNDVSAGIGFGNPFTRGVTIGSTQMDIGGSFNRQRNSLRTFTITDNFNGLITKLPDNYCNGKLVGPDYLYPITGKIGMKEVIKTFVHLVVFGNLDARAEDKNPAALPDAAPPTMVDAVTFETVIIGKVNPTKVIFSPIGNRFALLNSNVSAEVKRADKHIVTVGLALEKAAESQLEPYRDSLFARYGGLRAPAASRLGGRSQVTRGTLFGRLLTATGTPAEVAAAQAVDQFLTQRLFSPVININQ